MPRAGRTALAAYVTPWTELEVVDNAHRPLPRGEDGRNQAQDAGAGRGGDRDGGGWRVAMVLSRRSRHATAGWADRHQRTDHRHDQYRRRKAIVRADRAISEAPSRGARRRGDRDHGVDGLSEHPGGGGQCAAARRGGVPHHSGCVLARKITLKHLKIFARKRSTVMIVSNHTSRL